MSDYSALRLLFARIGYRAAPEGRHDYPRRLERQAGSERGHGLPVKRRVVNTSVSAPMAFTAWSETAGSNFSFGYQESRRALPRVGPPESAGSIAETRARS